MRDKMNDKMNNITEVIDIIVKINHELKKNISYINSVFCESVLLDDSQLKYKINAKIDDTLNFVWNEIYKKNRKNRISSNEVNTNKLKLLERMYNSTYDIIREVQNEILEITKNMFEKYEKDMDKVHLIYSELKEIMIRFKQDFKKIFNQEDLLC